MIIWLSSLWLAVVDITDLSEVISQHASPEGLPLKEAFGLSEQHNVSLQTVEKAALQKGIIPSRFIRNNFSAEEQLKLYSSKIVIVGCGGLGGTISVLLARIGIGSLKLIDPDIFQEHNLNRQHFCDIDSIGKAKVITAANGLIKINPAIKITPVISYFAPSDISDHDLVIDGLDNISDRKELNEECCKHDIPLIHGAVFEWYGQAGISTSSNNLIEILYPNSETIGTLPKVLAPTVSMIASIQVAESIKYLLEKESKLSKGWLSCDLLNCDFEPIDL